MFTLLDHFFKKIKFVQLHIYRKRHRIRISYSKYQFIIQNTPDTPEDFRTFRFVENFLNSRKYNKAFKIVFYNMYELLNSSFVDFVYFIRLYILYTLFSYIYTYIYIHVHEYLYEHLYENILRPPLRASFATTFTNTCTNTFTRTPVHEYRYEHPPAERHHYFTMSQRYS